MAKQQKEKQIQNIENRNLVNRIPSLMQYNEGSDRSKYDTTGITPLEEQRGQKQGFWDSAANITGRLIGRAGLSAVETVGMLGYGLPKAVVTGDMNAIFDNELTDKFKTFDDALVKSTPFYQTKAEQEASLFSKQYLTSTNFWGNLLGEGGGFVAGAVLGGGLIGKGIGLAGRVARSAGILAAEGEKIAEVASAAKNGNILDRLTSLARSASVRNSAQYYTQRIGGNMYEAGVEARGIKEEILRAKEEEFKSMYPYATPTEAQRAEWEDIANTYSNAGFGLNLGLLMIDGFNASKFLKGYKNTNRTVNALREGGQYVEKGKYGKIFDRLKVATGGPLSEMAQEGGQFLTEKTTTDLAAKTKTRDTELDFNEYFLSTMKGLEETFGSKEGQESMLAGFLLASPTNIAQAVREGTLDKDGIAILNKYITKDTFQKVLNYNAEAYENGSGESRDDAAYSNSKLTYETLQRKDWMKYVKSRDDAGRFDDVLDDIARERKAPLEVFNQIHGTDFNEEKRQRKLAELEKQAMFYKRTAENIEGSFTKHPAKEGIIETSVDINNYNERIASLESKKLDPSIDEATRANILTELEILKNDKQKADFKLASLLTGKPYVDEVEQSAAIPNQGDIVTVNNSPAVVEGVTTTTPAIAPPDAPVIPKPAEEIPITPEEIEAADALPADTSLPANPSDDNNVNPNPPAPPNPEVPPTVNPEDTTLIVSTPEGKQQIFPHEIEEDFMEDENLLDYPEESLFTEVNNPSSQFTEDIPRDLSKGEKGKSLVSYEKDTEGKPTGSIAHFSDYTDWNIQDHEVNYNQSKNIKVDAKQLAENRAAKELIIDKEETLTYHMVKQDNGNLQVIATDKDGRDYDIGYFLNPDVNKAARGSKVNPEITLAQFVSNYEGVHLEIAENLLTALRVLATKDSIDITTHVKLSSVVDNVKGQAKTLLKNVFGGKFQNRWLIDGEFVVALNNNGNYVAIDGLSKQKTDLLYSELENSKAVQSLGTQYVALVKRPDSNSYQFIGLKGRQHNQADIDGFKAEIEKYRNNPNLDIRNLVDNLNSQIFIPSNKTATIDGKEIPLHYKFAFKKNRELIVIGVPKIINGLEQNVKLPRPSRMTVEEALSVASVRVGKTSPEAKNREAIIQNTQTNAKPEIWRTFFAFDSMKFLGSIAPIITDAIETPTANAVEEVTPVPFDVETKNIQTLIKDGKYLYSLGVLENYRHVNNKPLIKGKKYLRIKSSDIVNFVREIEIVTGTGETYTKTQSSGFGGQGSSKSETENLSYIDSNGKLQNDTTYQIDQFFEIPKDVDFSNKKEILKLVIKKLTNNFPRFQYLDSNVIEFGGIMGFVKDSLNTNNNFAYISPINDYKTLITDKKFNNDKSVAEELIKIYNEELAALEGPKDEVSIAAENARNASRRTNVSSRKKAYNPIATTTDPRVISRLEEIRASIKKLINVDVNFFDSDFAYGAFTGSVILLNRGGWEKGTEWHEAFHAVFSVLPREEQAKILAIAHKRLGVTQEEIDKLREVYAKGGEVYDDQFLFEKVLEEKVADMFQDYMNGRPTGLFASFFDKFKKLIRMLLGIVERDEFKALFKNIEGGKYATMTPSGEIKSYSLIDGASALETNYVIRYLTTMYLNREEIDKELGTDSRAGLRFFISAELEKMRNNSAKINSERIAQKEADLRNAFEKKLITQKGLDDAFSNFYDELYEKNIEDEKGRIYSAYLSPENEELTIAQVIRHSNLRRVEDIEEDDEVAENRDFSASELEKSPQDTKAAQFVKDAMSALYYIKEGEVIPLNYVEVFNNLLLNLSGISNKTFVDPVTNKLTDSYEQALLKLTRTDSDLSLSIKSLLKLYNEDTHFKNNFRIALQRSFTNAYNIILTPKTLLDRNFVKNANNKDYVVKQVELWKSQILSKKINGGIVPNGQSLLESIGIVIEQDTLADPEAAQIMSSLSNDVRGLKDRIIVPAKDENGNLKNVFNASILDNLTKLAEINIKNRLDLGELNFKNAKGKSMHSMMQNSWVLNKLRALGKNFGIFTGNNFNGDRMDYNDLDPKKYFETLVAMYLNTSNGVRKPFYTIQQFEAKSTVPIVEGQDYSDISGTNFKNKIDAEQARQDANFQKVKAELSSRSKRDLVEGYHYFQSGKELVEGQEVKLPASRKIMNKYKELTGNEFTNSPEEVLQLVEMAERGELERNFLPRGFMYVNLPYYNEVKNPQYDVDAFNRMFSQQISNLKEMMTQFNITFDELSTKFNLEGMTEEGLLRNFTLNNYLNKVEILSQISPDLNQFKDFTDITKRGAGLLASGPNHGEGTFKFAIVPDSKLNFIANGNKMSAEELDAQGMETIAERMNRLERLGVISRRPNTKNPKSDAAYQRYLILQAYMNDDRDWIKTEDSNHDAVLKVDKTVGYGEEFYIKTAVYASVRYFHSRQVEEGTEGAFQDTDNGKYYLPMPGREYEWNLMNEMQAKGISSLFAKSAVKKGARSVAEEVDGKLSLSALEFNYEDYRLQQENPSGKVKIKDGTQLRQLLEAGFNPYYKLDDGRTITQTIEVSDTLLAEITNFNTMLYGSNRVYEVNGKKINPFTTYLRNSLESSATTDRMLEFFESKDGEFIYSTSMPMMKIKFEELLLAYFNNNIASQKTPGLKSTIISSKYYKTMVYNGKVITSYEYNELTEAQKAQVTTRDLNYSNPENKLSEIVLSEEYLDNLGMTIEEWVELKKAFEKAQETKIQTEESRLFDKISTVLCYRIPTQAQQSMMPSRVIDFLPRHYGSTAIPPAQITKMSGADYDVDSIFIHRHAVYRDKSSKLRSYGNDIESKKKSLAKNNFISDMVKEVEFSPERIALEKELSRAESKLKKLRRELLQPSSPAVKESILMEINLQREMIKVIEEDIEKVEEGTFAQVISSITGKTNMSLEEMIDDPDWIVTEKNFNDVLDNRIAVLTSDEGIKLLNSPAEDLFKDLYTNYFKDIFGKEDNYPVYTGADTQFIEYLKVAVGSKSISGSANINKIAGFLVKNNVSLTADTIKALKSYFNINFSSNDPNQSDISLEKNGKRIELKYEKDADGNITSAKVIVRGPKSDLLSSNVTLSVDNAKDQRLIEFNLNDKNMALASTLAALGFGTERLATFLLNPVSKLIASNLQLNPGFGKEVDKLAAAVKNIFSGIPRNPDITNFTDEDLIDGINNYDDIMDVLQGQKTRVIVEEDPWQAQADGKGISVIRGKSDKHYGNPFGAPDTSATVIMEGTVADRVKAFNDWLDGTAHQDVEPERREWILSQISSGKLDGKNLIYYKTMTEQSHADALAERVNYRKLRENPALLEIIQKQMVIGGFYTMVGKIVDDNFTINTILNFNKEVGRNASDITKIQFALLRIAQDKEFSYEKANIFSNPVIQQVRRTCEELKRNVSQQLLAYNHNVVKNTADLLNCTTKNTLEQGDNLFQKKLNDEFVEYLGMKAYSIYKPVVNLMTPATVMGPDGPFEETFSITDKEIINGNKVIAEYERVLEYMTEMKFPIANLLTIEEPSDKYPFRRLGSSTFSNLSTEDRQKLVDSFDELLSDPNTEVLGKYIITHIAAHDNFRYIANSLVDKARPVYFTSLNRVYKGMEGFDGMEQVFSMNQTPDGFRANFQQFFKGNIENYLYDFGKFFFSDIRNSIHLKGPETAVMTAMYNGDDKITPFKLNRDKDTFFFNIPDTIDRETLKFPYFFKVGKRVFTVSNITNDMIVYAPMPVVQSKKSVGLKLYQLDYNDYVRFINAAITGKTLEDDSPIVEPDLPAAEPVKVPTPDEVSESKKETVNPVETLTEETGDIPEVVPPSNSRTSTTYKYFGAQYTMILEDGKAVDVQNYKGKNSAKQKLIDAFNLNPDVDPQTGIRFRNNDILGGINFEKARQEGPGMGEYELFPGVFANEGQKVAIDKVKSYLLSNDDQFLLKGRGGTGKTTIIRKALEEFKRSKIIGGTVSDEARGILQENMKAYNTYTLASMLGLVADNDEEGNTFFRERNDMEKEAYQESLYRDAIETADIVIIDEASMVDNFLYDTIMTRKKPSAKVIFMGDNAQIAPIEGGESPVFDLLNTENNAVLTERMRQAGESPILPITDVYANNIEDIQNGNPGLQNPLTNRVDNFNSADNEGVLFINKSRDLVNMFVKDFENDPGFKSNIIVAATNKMVDDLNGAIRKEIFGDNAELFEVGDIVRLNSPHIENKVKILSNGIKGKVVSVKKINKANVPYQMYSLTVTTEMFNKELGKFEEKEVVFETIAPQDKPLFKTHLRNLAQKAKMREISWVEFYKAKESVMDVGYNYALTSHKVQGSTYRNVYVVEDNIMSFPDTRERVNRMMYTAISRPSKKLVIYSTKNPKTDSLNAMLNESPAVDTQPSQSTNVAKNPSEYTNHSGGAIFSDTEWDLIGREFGVTKHNHYREPGSSQLDSEKLRNLGIKPVNISQEDYNEGVQKATKALRQMYTDSQNKTVRSPYIIRNWAQVKYADAVYAIGTIKQPGEKVSDKKDDDRIAATPLVKGGTGYAVQMAINESKPVYVFDGTKEGWYTYDYKLKNFIPTEIPTLTKNFAGIGSRSLATQEVIDKSLQAIRNVYKKTFRTQTSLIQTAPTQENQITGQVINKILANFEKYEIQLDALGIFSQRELLDLSPEEKDILVQKLCNV